MKNIKGILTNFNTHYGVVLEENASYLTQGNSYGKYQEGSDPAWYF